MTYATLQSDIADYLHRGDLNTLLPSFISRAEAYLFRELQVKDLGVSVAGTTTGEYADLPADFATVSRITIVIGSVEYALDYKSNEANTSVTYPVSYALENNKIRIFGANTGQAYTLYYIPKIQPLSTSNTTNWLLDNAEDLYLYASALEGAKYIRDESLIAQLTGYVTPLLDSVRRLSERKGQPANGSMQIKPRR
jgi:hypothetical protein